MLPQNSGGRYAPVAGAKRRGEAGNPAGRDRLDPRFEAAGARRLGHRAQARHGPQDGAQAPRGRSGGAGLRYARGAVAPCRAVGGLPAGPHHGLAGPGGQAAAARIEGARLRRLLRRRHRHSARRPAAKGTGLRASLRVRRRQAGAGRFRLVPARVHRRARRCAHPMAVHDHPWATAATRPRKTRHPPPSRAQPLNRARPRMSVARKRKRSGWSAAFARTIIGEMRQPCLLADRGSKRHEAPLPGTNKRCERCSTHPALRAGPGQAGAGRCAEKYEGKSPCSSASSFP